MTATTPEQNTGGVSSETEALKAEVARQSAAQLADEVRKLNTKAQDVKTKIEQDIARDQKVPDSLGGDVKDKDSTKGKAADVKRVVQKVLLAVKSPEKIPTPTGKPGEVVSLSSTILQKLSDQINPEYDVSDKTAPYLHQLIHKAISGEIASIDDLALEMRNLGNLRAISPELFKKVQRSLADTAKEKGMSEEEAKKKFGLEEQPDERETHSNGDRGSFERIWMEHYSSYFNNEDKPFVESLYSATKFGQYVETLQAETAARMGKDRGSEEVQIEVSKDIERRTVDLFGKLYTRLDHEKPSEFFHEIEQQDIMRGILPVKNELKRRMTQLAVDLERAHEEGKIHDLGLFQRIELRPDVEDVQYETIDKEKRIKPRYRLNPYTKPAKAEPHHFIHYLDQIVDQYVEARKYTHNARAIFLHPVDHEKGFYSQLSHFANDMSTVDFDQMMALPDNEIFRDAFSLYDKMVDETFASNDWRHFPTMFELKQNSLHTQVEEDVLDKLKLMYKGKPDMTEARLEAALSMAVGASRGMFLTEIEKAAFADPHLTEDGKATFASYYNQDASALVTFNPMHQHFRWQAPNTMDPILFMPVEGFKGSQTFADHRDIWKKMQGYRDSFVSGRGKTGIEGETLWSDFLVNVGKVGGPLQRKGWRTGYMLEPLYVKDSALESEGKFGYDYAKTWKRFENIGYEVAQDFVAKLPTSFTGQYEGKHGVNKKMLDQKKELFSYLYSKYFGGDPDKVEQYMKGLRSKAEEGVIKSIRNGHSAPRDIKEAVEIEASNQFLYRVLARMVADRIPSKILRIDRDRLSKDGISRWRKIAQDMKLTTAQFDDLMKDLLLAEQLLRKDVSLQMRQSLADGKEPWRHGEIAYKLTEEKVAQLLEGKVDGARIAKVNELLRNIQTSYTKNNEFLDGKLTTMLKSGEYKFTFAADEVDMSFIPWRGAGARVLPRAIGDISVIEKTLAAEMVKIPKTLQQIAIDGKHDFSPIIEIMTKAYGALDGIIGTDYAHRVVHHIAALTINYFKKDTMARVAMGVFGVGKKNSLAAERAGRSTAVWEWDSRQIDNFCVALETRGLLPLKPYSPVNSSPTYEPVYLNLPGTKPIKLPESINVFGRKIPLFSKRKADFEWSIKNLRDQFGGNWKDKAFDTLNNYLPIVIVLLLMKYMRDALKESEGGKKK